MCLILFYNRHQADEIDLENLPEFCRASFTRDRSRFNQADAVVFHPPSLEKIDNLVKPERQLWIMWSLESVVNYPVLTDPTFRSLFDLTMTYERHADIFEPYIPRRETWHEAMARPLPVKTATAPCVIFQSSNVNRSGRFGYLAELMKHIGVHSYGKIFNNCAIPDQDRGAATKLEIVSRYKFCLAMENSICDDYVTEKLFEPLLCGTVPVYLGAPNVDRYAPNDHALINVRDFAGPKALGEFYISLIRMMPHIDAISNGADSHYGPRWNRTSIAKAYLSSGCGRRSGHDCRSRAIEMFLRFGFRSTRGHRALRARECLCPRKFTRREKISCAPVFPGFKEKHGLGCARRVPSSRPPTARVPGQLSVCGFYDAGSSAVGARLEKSCESRVRVWCETERGRAGC